MKNRERLIWLTLFLVAYPVWSLANQQPQQGQEPAAVSEDYDYPVSALRFQEKYDKLVAEADAVYAKELAEVNEQYELAVTNVVDRYTVKSQRARKEYLKALDTVIISETRSKREYRAAWVKYVRDLAVGPQLSSTQEHWSLSYAAEERGDYGGAIRHINEVLRKSGNYYNAYAQLRIGYLYTLKLDYLQAEQAYLSATRIAPTSISPLTGLLYCYVQSQRVDKVQETAAKLVEIDPLNYYANKSLGYAAYQKSDYETAADYYYRLSVAYPDDLAISNSLGWCYMYQQKYKQGAAIFGSILIALPYDENAKSGYAYCLKAMELEQAQPAVEETGDGDKPAGDDPAKPKNEPPSPDDGSQ
jgi:tetratricopeptide (TPR) repeat protein